jgi:hypothetical protein
MIPAKTVPPDFEAQTQRNQQSMVLGGFEAQQPKHAQVAYSIRVPHILDTCPTGPQLHWQHNPLLHVLAPISVPRCQPPWLVTQLLQSLSQNLTLVLRHSWSISMNPHDLYLHCQAPSPNYTHAHHKLRDMFARTQTHTLGSPTDSPQGATH